MTIKEIWNCCVYAFIIKSCMKFSNYEMSCVCWSVNQDNVCRIGVFPGYFANGTWTFKIGNFTADTCLIRSFFIDSKYRKIIAKKCLQSTEIDYFFPLWINYTFFLKIGPFSYWQWGRIQTPRKIPENSTKEWIYM